jgi:hypothetical protein
MSIMLTKPEQIKASGIHEEPDIDGLSGVSVPDISGCGKETGDELAHHRVYLPAKNQPGVGWPKNFNCITAILSDPTR